MGVAWGQGVCVPLLLRTGGPKAYFGPIHMGMIVLTSDAEQADIDKPPHKDSHFVLPRRHKAASCQENLASQVLRVHVS